MISTPNQTRARGLPTVSLFLLFAAIALPCYAHAQTIEWIRQFGTTAEDQATGAAPDSHTLQAHRD